MSAPRTVLGLVVASGLLLGGGVAAGALAATGALASSSSPSASPSGAPSAPDGRGPDGKGPGGRMHGFGGPGAGLGGMLHGEIVVEKQGGGTETLLVQRGTVTAKTADGVTVRSSDGFTTTWKVTSDTKVWAGRPAAGAAAPGLADVAKDAEVVVTGPKSTGDPTARMLAVRPAGAPDGMRGFGRHRDGGGFGDRDGRPGAPGAPTAPSASPTASAAVLQG